MNVIQFAKSGEQLYRDFKITPTQEMQELIDIFWSQVIKEQVKNLA